MRVSLLGVAVSGVLPSLVALGEASCALHLLHAPLDNWLRAVDTYLEPGWRSRGPGFLTGYALRCVAVSLGVFRYVEEPARRRLAARERPAPAAGLDVGMAGGH
ncbi:hypothetical protein JY651_33180 [Pyxidicoccus parkwayensis]|uniref:Uncharacterized protein n=1 Tax=Pyxidicoccus parkwayensis TaxID=2813578 RepID=A0ABX7NRS6_9BACT|nr:hypothetical protein [Pyxidicoccus parkwaysis]QSQ20101.1 hypothetical protein JY651_33180 [Pyxidicoccus parkwaysis]